MNYWKHLISNWKIALHSLNDFAEHFLHGLIPAIHWGHECARNSITVNVNADTSEVEAAIEKAKQLKSLVEEVKSLTASIVIRLSTDRAK